MPLKMMKIREFETNDVNVNGSIPIEKWEEENIQKPKRPKERNEYCVRMCAVKCIDKRTHRAMHTESNKRIHQVLLNAMFLFMLKEVYACIYKTYTYIACYILLCLFTTNKYAHKISRCVHMYCLYANAQLNLTLNFSACILVICM